MESCQTSEVQRCIQIGLLSVQEDPADRPTMSTVVALLGNESIALPPPRQPALSVGKLFQSSTTSSVNGLTVSGISPRWRLTKIGIGYYSTYQCSMLVTWKKEYKIL